MKNFYLHFKSTKSIPTIFCLFLVLFTNQSFSQKNELDVRKLNTQNFPEVSGKLWVRDPEGVKTEHIQFFEEDKPIMVNFGSFEKVDSFAKNKSILFLVRNSGNQEEMNWYKNVLINAIKTGDIKNGDKIAVIGFSCLINKQILFPNKLNFTDNTNELISRVNEISNKGKKEIFGRVQTHIAINEALQLLEAQNLNIPTGIFVISDDQSMPPLLTGELPGPRSKRLNVPIYGISYHKKSTFYDIKELCIQTYGRYYSNASNKVELASKEINLYLSNFIERHSGLFYPFTYQSTFEKDGKNHTVKIDSKEGQSGFSLAVPSKNIIEIISDNPIISGSFFLLFSGVAIIIFNLIKKNKIKKAELELQQKLQFEEMEKQQKNAEHKLSNQETELQKLKEEEHRKEELLRLQKAKEIKQKEEEVQLNKMLERGNLPWFEFRFGEETGSYQIQSPRISVGRDAGNTWVINHPTVSRNHFQLTFHNYSYSIKDLGSSNGLYVNGDRVSEIELKHGDCIQIGEITLSFHI
jgi:hypothetical protein